MGLLMGSSISIIKLSDDSSESASITGSGESLITLRGSILVVSLFAITPERYTMVGFKGSWLG